MTKDEYQKSLVKLVSAIKSWRMKTFTRTRVKHFLALFPSFLIGMCFMKAETTFEYLIVLSVWIIGLSNFINLDE